MNRSVVTHHRTAWWRSHRATSRCTAGSVLRRRCGRGGKGVAWATLPPMTAPLPLFQPDQEAVREHDGHGMPMKARPQAALVLVPAQLPFGLLMKLLDRMPAMGQAGQLFKCGLRRQVAPELFPLLGLPPLGALSQHPALMPLPVTGHPPTADRDKLLAPPAFGPLPPANHAPLPTGDGLEPLVRPPHPTGRHTPQAHREVGPHPDHIWLLPRLQPGQEVGIVPSVGIGDDAAMGHPPGPRLIE